MQRKFKLNLVQEKNELGVRNSFFPVRWREPLRRRNHALSLSQGLNPLWSHLCDLQVSHLDRGKGLGIAKPRLGWGAT
jgi:hypothetical protein